MASDHKLWKCIECLESSAAIAISRLLQLQEAAGVEIQGGFRISDDVSFSSGETGDVETAAIRRLASLTGKYASIADALDAIICEINGARKNG